MRKIVILGSVLDLLAALFLLLVSGWIIDAWDDTRVPWAGIAVTIPWALALILTAGAPPFAYWRYKRGAARNRAALIVWTPIVLFVLICGVGLVLSPP